MTFMTGSSFHECTDDDLIISHGVFVCRVCGLVAQKAIDYEDYPNKKSIREFNLGMIPVSQTQALPSRGYKIEHWFNGQENKTVRCFEKLMKMVNLFGLDMPKMTRAVYIVQKLLKNAPKHESTTIAAISVYVTMKETHMRTTFIELMKKMKENAIPVKNGEFKRLLNESKNVINVKYEKKIGIARIAEFLINCLDFHVKMNLLTGGSVKVTDLIKKSALLAVVLKKNDKKPRRRPYSSQQAYTDAFFKILAKNGIVVDFGKQDFMKFIRTGTWTRRK